jgi:catechol 2,3-dioxygenase-like lactoylglutathione lyase family enzyme
MKKTIFILLLIAISFGSGFAFKAALTTSAHRATELKRVTGIGGIFFKCKEPAKMRAWYKEHLGLQTNPYGAVFEWRQGTDTLKKGFTQWTPFNEKTGYFKPSDKDFMINYRVANLSALMVQLKKEGVDVLDSVETADYGKFVHIMDIEGNKIELWEPNDVEYEKMGKKMGAQTTR